MRRSLTSLVLIPLSAFAFMAACGGEEDPPPPIESDLGDGDTSLDPDQTRNDSQYNRPGSPDVEVVVGDGAENVFTTEAVATCTATSSQDNGATPVDPATVKFVLLDADGMAVVEPATEEGSDEDQYTATFAFADLPTGEYRLRCIADNTGPQERLGMGQQVIYIDRGPNITTVTPSEGEALSASSTENFEFRIEAAELFSGDDEAAVAGEATVTINGTTFPLVPKPDTDDVYWVNAVDLDNPATFTEGLPSGETLVTVSATNARGIEGIYSFNVLVDSEGPSVRIKSPKDLDIIGKFVTFEFEVDDDFSGVDWDTMVVVFAEQEIPFENMTGIWSVSGDTATLTINTTDYAGTRDVSINVDVSDNAGNRKLGAASASYHLDQYGPILALDPPDFRARNKDGECSHAFDPVGPRAVNHGGDVDTFATMRGVVWDRTNTSVNVWYYALADESSVQLWVSPWDAENRPLVVDADEDVDNACDAIDETGAALIEFEPINPTGSPFYGDGTLDSSSPALNGCPYKGATMPPDRLCMNENSDMTFVAEHGVEGEPVIFSFGVTSGFECTGSNFEPSTYIGQDYQGWVCAALSARDTVGNTSVSEPIAFCLDNPLVPGAPGCAGAGPGGAPDCSDGCTPLTFPADGMTISDP